MLKRDIIVIGTSSGGQRVLSALVRELPKGFQAALFVVSHISAHHHSILPEILNAAGNLPATHAVDGEPIRSSRIYIAPPDHHLLLEPETVRVTKGPKENRFRPAIDTLFRSAAYAFGPRAIGIVLTGALEDGTAGLWAIKDRGGIAIVQDPHEAEYSSMPLSAKQNVKVDYCLPLAEIVETLNHLIDQPAPAEEHYPSSDALRIETQISLEHNPLDAGIMNLGTTSVFTCPTCHGALLKINDGRFTRFRCHTGHSFTISSLLTELTESTENALWSAVRTLDENIMLLNHMAGHAQEERQHDVAKVLKNKAMEAKRQSDLVRKAALAQQTLKTDERSDRE